MKNKKFSTITFNVAAFRKGSGDRLHVASVQHGRIDLLVDQPAMGDELKKALMQKIKVTVDRMQRDLS